MNIGIDIDGVLTDISKFKVEYGLKYCNEVKKGKLIVDLRLKIYSQLQIKIYRYCIKKFE